jgi:hypothetical protein
MWGASLACVAGWRWVGKGEITQGQGCTGQGRNKELSTVDCRATAELYWR